MGRTTTRVLALTAALLLASGVGGGRTLHAAAPEPVASEPVAPEMNPGAEKTIEGTVQGIVEGFGEKVGVKLGEQIGEQNVAKIDDAHEDSARFIGLFFEKVDRVFGEQYVEDRDRKIQVRAGLETTFNDNGDSIDTRARIGLRVPLPALKRRFNVFVDIGGDANELGAVSSPNFSESEKIVSIAAGFLRRFGDNLEAGLKLKLFRSSGAFFSLYPFVRFEHQYDKMRYFFEQQLIWESDNSWSTLTDFDVDRRFRSGLLLRLRNRIDWSFEDPGASIAHGLIVRRNVKEKNGVSLEFWVEYNTAKNDLETIADDTITYAQLRLRGRIWRNWLEYELRPIYTVPIGADRNSFFSFFVSLTVLWDSYLGGDAVGEASR